MIKQKLLVRGARQLLTLRGLNFPRRGPALQELSIISDGALLISDGRIEEAGPSRRLENLASARGAMEINASGRVVMPGFVDSHTQIVFAHSGGRLDQTGDQETADAAEKAMRTVTGRWLQAHAARLTHGMVRHGTCTIEAKSGYGLDDSGQLKALRVHAALNRNPLDIVSTFLGASAVPLKYQDDGERWLDHLCAEMLPSIQRRKLARFVDIRFDAFGYTQARKYLEAARKMGFGIKVQTGAGSASDAVRLALELKAVAIGTSRHLTPSDTSSLAHSSTVVTLLPNSVFQTGEEPYDSARALIDEGGIVALGSNFNPDTNPGYSMQSVIGVACRRLELTPAEAVTAATFNAAYAIGCSRDVGSLEPGKDADILLLNLADYRDIAYDSGVNNVYMTMKKGVAIYREAEIRPAA